MDANGRQISVKMTSGLLGSEKQGVFPDLRIRILPLDPMVGGGRGFLFFGFAKCDTGYSHAYR